MNYEFKFTEHQDDEKQQKESYNTIRQIIDDETPVYADFIDVYSQAEMEKDAAKVQKIKDEIAAKEAQKPKNPDELGIKQSKLLEFVITEYIGSGQDWFHETQRGKDFFGDTGDNLLAFPTHEFDDFINHSDIACVINNKDTNFQPIPFILDATFNTDEEGLQKKMDWRHPSTHSKGFMMLKYFRDNISGDSLPKGRIAIAPRFVIGFNPEMAKNICDCRIAGPDNLKAVSAMNADLNRAKWCVLSEIMSQLPRMTQSVDEMENSPLKDAATQQLSVLIPYFKTAYELAEQNDAANSDFPQSDPVAQAISRHAEI